MGDLLQRGVSTFLTTEGAARGRKGYRLGREMEVTLACLVRRRLRALSSGGTSTRSRGKTSQSLLRTQLQRSAHHSAHNFRGEERYEKALEIRACGCSDHGSLPVHAARGFGQRRMQPL